MVSFLGVFLFEEGVCMAQGPSFYVRLRQQEVATRCRWPLVPNKTCSMDHFGSKKGVEMVRLARLGQKSTFWFEWELFQLVGCLVFFCHIVAVFEGRALLPLVGRPVFLGCCLLRCYCHCVL